MQRKILLFVPIGVTIWGISQRSASISSPHFPYNSLESSSQVKKAPISSRERSNTVPRVLRVTNRDQEAAANPKPQASDGPMQLLAPVSGPPQNSDLQITLLNSISGNLVCGFSSKKRPHESALVLCKVAPRGNGLGTSPPGAQSSALSYTTYPVRKSAAAREQTLYDARFSPDGRYVLFKFGDLGSGLGESRLYVLDTETNEVKLIPLTIGYQVISWSPDSRYIACVEGGDAYGNPYFQAGSQGMYLPLRLHVCDWRTGKSQLVVANDTVRGPFSWTGLHTLLYGALSPKGQNTMAEKWRNQILENNQNKEPATKENQQPNTKKDRPTKENASAKNVPLPRPDIYTFSSDIGQPKLAFHDGYLPTLSPNGEWVAFFGSEHPDKPYPLRSGWESEAQGTALCIAHLDGTARKALNRESGFYPLLYWLSDNRHLIAVKETQSNPVERIQIKEWDTQTGHWRQLVLLEAKDRDPQLVPGLDAHFQFLGVSQDDNSIYVIITEFGSSGAPGEFVTGEGHLDSIDLRTGKIKLLLNIKGDSGTDWHEDTSPATSTTAPKIP